jgi:hypothetical protein
MSLHGTLQSKLKKYPMTNQKYMTAFSSDSPASEMRWKFLNIVGIEAREKFIEETCYFANVGDVFFSYEFVDLDRCIVVTYAERYAAPDLYVTLGSPATLVRLPSGKGRVYVEHGIFSFPEAAISYATGGIGALLVLISNTMVTVHKICVSSASSALPEVRRHIELRKSTTVGQQIYECPAGSLAMALTQFRHIEIDDEWKARERERAAEEVPF